MVFWANTLAFEEPTLVFWANTVVFGALTLIFLRIVCLGQLVTLEPKVCYSHKKIMTDLTYWWKFNGKGVCLQLFSQQSKGLVFLINRGGHQEVHSLQLIKNSSINLKCELSNIRNIGTTKTTFLVCWA